MIVFNIVVWSIVSAVWAALAWWKSSEGLRSGLMSWLVLVRLVSSLCTWWGWHHEASS